MKRGGRREGVFMLTGVGRFPQVSNIRFTFDPSRPPGSRVISASIGGEPIQAGKKYTLATRGYMSRGKGIPPQKNPYPDPMTPANPFLTNALDGYDSLLVEDEGGAAEELVDEENGMLISTMLRQYFMALRTVGKWKYLNTHWDAIATAFPPSAPPSAMEMRRRTRDAVPAEGAWAQWLARRTGISVKPEEDSETEDGGDDDAADERIDWEVLLMRKYFWRWAQSTGKKSRTCDPMAEDAVDVDWTRVIAPVLEGRITNIQEA